MKYVFILGFVLYILKLNWCFPHNSTVISKYAKVAVWGNNKTDSSEIRNEGRASKSGNIWNHRLDPKSISPTTKKKNLSVIHQYPVYQRPESKIDKHTEHVPGIGEVIVAHAQDRFEARPLFAYKNKVPSPSYGPPPAAAQQPNPTLAPIPTPATPAANAAQSSDFYNSPYSSYNPPNFKPDDLNNGDLYPPNIPSDAGSNSADQAAPLDSQMSAATEAAKPNAADLYASLGPPLAPYGNGHDDQNNHDYEQQEFQDPAPPQDPMAMYKYQDGPPQHPPKSLDDVYYPPDFPKEQIGDHGMEGNGDDMAMDPHSPHDPHDTILPEDPGVMDSGKSNGDVGAEGDHGDDASPPLHSYGHGHAFPQYLYDHHHYDHHVYEEIPHTTMAPAKEDKRVSTTNYSYYYLGRKLWYIPLYFSIYFIIYVTVLILKSIARHKVRLKYKWYEHDHAKQARSMDIDAIRHEQITDLYQNVSLALKNATAKYDSVLAM